MVPEPKSVEIPDLQDKKVSFLAFFKCLQSHGGYKSFTRKQQIFMQITKSIVSNQIHAVAERLSDHLLNTSNVKSMIVIFAEVPSARNLPMIDWALFVGRPLLSSQQAARPSLCSSSSRASCGGSKDKSPTLSTGGDHQINRSVRTHRA